MEAGRPADSFEKWTAKLPGFLLGKGTLAPAVTERSRNVRRVLLPRGGEKPRSVSGSDEVRDHRHELPVIVRVLQIGRLKDQCRPDAPQERAGQRVA